MDPDFLAYPDWDSGKESPIRIRTKGPGSETLHTIHRIGSSSQLFEAFYVALSYNLEFKEINNRGLQIRINYQKI